MKLIFLTLIMVVYLMDATTEAQRRPLCMQGANPVNCTGAMDNGTSCSTASARRMWYYDSNSRGCRNMSYLGCGGNNNRFCSWIECVFRCVRIIRPQINFMQYE